MDDKVIEEMARAIADPGALLGVRLNGESLSHWQGRACASIVQKRIEGLEAENARLRDDMNALDRIIEGNIKDSDGPDRVRWEGVWYDGPLATAYLSTLRAIQKLARAALNPDSPLRSNP